MIERVVATSLAIGLSLAACSEGTKSRPQDRVDPPLECVELFFETGQHEAVKAVAQQRIASALKLAKNIHDEEVRAVGEFIRANATYETFSDSKVELVVVRKNQPYDCGFLDFMASAPAFGQYNREAEALIIIDNEREPVSDLWGGLLTIHEFRHARSRSLSSESPLEERDTRIFEQRIMAAVGGEPYQQVLQELKALIAKTGFNQADGFVIKPDAMNTFDATKLDKIFGVPLSETDKSMRNVPVFLHALFELIAETAPAQGMDTANAQQATIDHLQRAAGIGS